jgi:hypothetical protein
MRRLIMLPIIALVSACSHAEPGIEIREIPVPTPIACVKPEQIPAEPDKVGDQLTGEARHDLSIVAESALALRKYGGQLRALLEGCV